MFIFRYQWALVPMLWVACGGETDDTSGRGNTSFDTGGYSTTGGSSLDFAGHSSTGGGPSFGGTPPAAGGAKATGGMATTGGAASADSRCPAAQPTGDCLTEGLACVYYYSNHCLCATSTPYGYCEQPNPNCMSAPSGANSLPMPSGGTQAYLVPVVGGATSYENRYMPQTGGAHSIADATGGAASNIASFTGGKSSSAEMAVAGGSASGAPMPRNPTCICSGGEWLCYNYY